jgi:FeS assembly SUF system protein
MGIFSFLNKSTTSDGTPEPVQSAGYNDKVTDQPINPAPQTPDTPFVRPAAWDTQGMDIDVGALTAPSTATSDQPTVGPPDPNLTAEYQSKIIEVIKTVFDPEIPVDIYELGLIYDIVVDTDRRALVRMTLTSPACPSAQQLPSEVRYKVKALEGIADAAVEIVWEPAWDKDRMSEAAKLQLGFF